MKCMAVNFVQSYMWEKNFIVLAKPDKSDYP